MLLKALVEGFGITTKKKSEEGEFEVPTEAIAAMQQSAAQAIAAKSKGAIPMVRGKDKGLPKAAPVFDLNELRKRNVDVLRQKVKGANSV